MRRALIVVSLLLASFTTARALPPEEAAALDRLPGQPIQVLGEFREQPLGKIFTAIAGAARFEVEVEDGAREIAVTASWGDLPLKEMLTRLADAYSLRYDVTEEGKLRVGRRDGA